MTIAILAPRMRKLFERWLNDEFEQPLTLPEAMLQEPVDNSVDMPYDEFVEQEMPAVIWEGLE